MVDWNTLANNIIPPNDPCYFISFPNLTYVPTVCIQLNETFSPISRMSAQPHPSPPHRHVNNYIIHFPTPNFASVTGAFDTEKLTSVESNREYNSYSIQLNTNDTLTAPLSQGSYCRGWQQFVYVPKHEHPLCNHGCLFIEYWMIHYLYDCPNGWASVSPNPCFITSRSATSTPSITAANLDVTHLNVTFMRDTRTKKNLTVLSLYNKHLNTSYYYRTDFDPFSLQSQWKSLEFTIVGNSNGQKAYFNYGATINFELNVYTTEKPTKLPTLSHGTYTDETNNLTLIFNSLGYLGKKNYVLYSGHSQ